MINNTELLKIGHRVSDLLFPKRCVVCDEICKVSGKQVCNECQMKIRYISQPICYKCGKKLATEEMEYCHDCSKTQHLYERGYGLYEYECMKQSLYRYKYKNRREYASFYAREMKEKLGHQIWQMQAQALVPIPLHKSKKRVRGYNQAEVLAEEISKQLGIPVWKDFLIRIRKTVPQKELNPVERQNNLKKAFKIGENDVKLKTIILVDDIYTTGSTIDAATEVLLDSGAERVFYLSLAIGAGI